jgi:hypothetical protein
MIGEHPQGSFLDGNLASGRLLERGVGAQLFLYRPLAWPSLCNRQSVIKNS